MNLNELFNNRKKALKEGGNLSVGGHDAQQIDLKVHNRSFIVPILDTLLNNINNAFAKTYKKPLWQPQLLQSKQFLSGSSLHFFNTKGITDQEFVSKKPKVGDIDTQVNKENEQELEQWLSTSQGKMVGNAKFLGFQRGNEQFSSLWELQDPPIKVQIDLEFVAFDKDEPTPWSKFSHSSSWDDLNAGVKGVFHKFLIQSLASLSRKDFLLRKAVGRGKAKEIQDIPTTDNMVSFAVSSKEGGGLRAKYEPVLDANGQPVVVDGMPVMQALPASGYEQDIGKIFGSIFGTRLNPKQAAQLESKYWSFVGLIDAMNTLVTPEEKQSVLSAFIDKIFGKGAQGLYKGDPERDSAEKSAALDLMINKLGVQAPADLEQMKQQYKAAYKVTSESLQEAEVKAQFRKNMPHLRDLKPIDFLDLLDEIQDGNGNFKLQNIPLNVKIDGFGGRFGKDAEGKPFMATSNTPPRYKAGFVQYHQDKGTTDPEILGRAEKFDELFNEMMNAIKLVDSKLGADFLVNKQVTCEVLFLPFASETSEGKLKFVGIQYDKFPPGVELVLVPFRVVDASSGEDVPDANDVVTSLSKLGGQGSVRFVSNSLVQQDGLDVTEIINPLDNIEELKQIVSDTVGKRDRASLQLRREVEEKLMPVKIALEKAIDADPNIIGKDILGQDYEGIVINSRLGPIKVTSQKQKDIITQKNAAKAAARAEQPRGENKTAVVAIGSFVGHKGHQQLFGLTIDKAKEVSGDPYLFMGSAVGADDPIPVADKIKTWKQLYPEYAGNIGAVTQEGGSLMQKIKHELINPLPGKPPRYDNVIIMVGEDQAKMPIAQALMKAVNKFPGYEHVKVQLEVTPRGTGMSFTKLRNVLKTGDEQQAFQMWNDAFNGGQDGAKPLPPEWIKHLMDVSKTGMGTPQPKLTVKKLATQPTPQPVQQPALGEMRLFNALMSPNKIVNEETIKERKRKKNKGAAWGPGPYGWYGFDAGYSGDGGGDGGMGENFADGKNPQDKGDSKRHGVPTKASVSTLRKVAKQGGRKGQLAHWMANMKAGKAKKNEEFNGEYDDEAGMAQSNLRTLARAVDGLLKTIKNNDNLPEWGQEKIAKAEMMLVSVWDYLQSQKELGMNPKVDMAEATSAAIRLHRAIERQRAKSDASLRRTPSSIPKPEPKKEQGVAEKFDPRKMKSTNDTDVRTVGAGAVRVPSDASREIWNEPTWSFKEIADKLGVSTNTLNLLAWKQIGGFPDARPGLTSKHGSSKYYKQSEVKRWVNANKVRELIKGRVATNQSVAEAGSDAMANTASRLANKDDGKVAKLRAAGDKRREEELKGRNIAKKNEAMLPTSAFAGSDKNKLAPQGQLKGTAPKEQPRHKLVGETDKKKGADGKACWKNFKYAGTKNGKDKCVPIGEAYEAEMAAAILKLVEGKI
jgi:hypothetical protein